MTNSKKGKSNNKGNTKNNSGNNNTTTGFSQVATSSSTAMASSEGLATHNSFDALYTSDVDPDAPSLPVIPDIDKMKKMDETQRKKMLLAFAIQLDLRPDHLTAQPTPAAEISAADPTKSLAGPAASTTAASTAAASTAAAATSSSEEPAAHQERGTPNMFRGGREQRGSVSCKRKAEETAEANKRPRQQGSNNGYKTETVFLSGVKDLVRKNDIVFQREFSKAVPGIKIKNAFFTRSGSVGLIPATPHDVNALLAEDWTNHTNLGDSVKASPDRSKIIAHRAVITGVNPDLDDDSLKEELEDRNNLKLTSIKRLPNRATGTGSWKVILGLEDEGTQKRVLRDGLLLGFTNKKCIPPHDNGRTGGIDRPITQCFHCQEWDPKHNNSNCQGVRACVWCAADHFHKECPLFQARNKENAKCVNCKGAHPAWSKSCPSYTEASQCSTKVTAARVVSSSSISKADLDTAMGELWKSLAGVIATVAARSVLDLRAEEERAAETGSKVSGTMLSRKVAATILDNIVPLTLEPASAALSSSALRSRTDRAATVAITPARDFHSSPMAASRSALLIDEEETTLAAVTLVVH